MKWVEITLMEIYSVEMGEYNHFILMEKMKTRIGYFDPSINLKKKSFVPSLHALFMHT